MAFNLPTTAVKYGYEMHFHVIDEKINMDYELYKYTFQRFRSIRLFELIYWNVQNTMSIQFHVWKTFCKKKQFVRKLIFFILPFYDDKDSMQEYDLYSCCKERSVNK